VDKKKKANIESADAGEKKDGKSTKPKKRMKKCRKVVIIPKPSSVREPQLNRPVDVGVRRRVMRVVGLDKRKKTSVGYKSVEDLLGARGSRQTRCSWIL